MHEQFVVGMSAWVGHLLDDDGAYGFTYLREAAHWATATGLGSTMMPLADSNSKYTKATDSAVLQATLPRPQTLFISAHTL